MAVLIVLLALALFLAGYPRVVASLYGPRPTPDETHTVTTGDGWRVALHRYRPRGERPHGEPVLLHHGLSGTYKNFDLGVGTPEAPVPSLAHWLADRGYDVWAVDLRGRGASEKPRLFGDKRWDWAVDEFVEQDDPAFVAHILATTGFANLHWVGLSMGGILLLCAAGREGSPRIASGVALGSGLAYAGTGSGYEPLIRWVGLARFLKRAPTGLLAKLQAPLCGRSWVRVGAFNFYPENIAPQGARAIEGGSLEDIPGSLLAQMATLFAESGLTSRDGRVRYVDLAARITTPILTIAGEEDRQSSPELADKTRRALPENGDHAVRKFGRSFGHPEHYGHIDLVAGLRADRETFPAILEWIQAHPAKRASA
jgi:pimeloyl-ACP methyl ester carboxylesterase